jgi:hypothetical protein
MAKEFHGIAYWPGIKLGVISCTYTCVDGMAPGIASLVIPWQEIGTLQRIGDLRLTDSINPTLTLKGCLLDRIDTNEDRTHLVLTIKDRRWKWAHGTIDGWYNQIDPQPTPDKFFDEGGRLQWEKDDSVGVFSEPGPFIPGTKRSLWSLIRLCLDAMGEPTDNKMLSESPPIDAFPAVYWQKQNPAAALQTLLDSVGWRLSYQPFPKDRCLIHPLAGKFTVPDKLPVTYQSIGLNPMDKPKAARVYGGPVWLSDRLELEAVGFEANGEILPIDLLSYKPKKGWDDGPPEWWDSGSRIQIGNCESREQAADLANRYVFKCFRIVCSKDKPIDAHQMLLDGIAKAGGSRYELTFAEPFKFITDRRRIVLGPAIYTANRDATGQPEAVPAFVAGEFYDEMKSYSRLISATNEKYNRTEEISIDTNRGLVFTSRPMFIRNAIGQPRSRAKIYVTTSFQVRDAKTNTIVVYEKGKVYNEADASELIPEEVIIQPEILLTTHVERKYTPPFDVLDGNSNMAECDKQADYSLKTSRLKYSNEFSLTRTYFGLQEINPGIGIRQVTYSINGGAAGSPSTQIAVNTESNVYVPPYNTRRRFIINEWKRFNAEGMG